MIGVGRLCYGVGITARNVTFATTAMLLSSFAQADTLPGVVQEALETNPELGAIKFNRHAIDHELTAARGLVLPSADVRADGGRRHSLDTTAAGNVTGTSWHTNRSVGTVTSQRIFDGFEARSEINRQRNRVESARWRVMDTANSIALRTVQAYLEVQRAKAVLNAARSNVTQHESLLARVRTRVSGGRGSSSDETEALSRMAGARALQLEAQNRLDDAVALFRAVVGRGPGQLAAVKPPAAALPKTVDDAVAEASVAAPSVLATQHDVDAAQATVAAANSRFFPRLNLEVSTNHVSSAREIGDRSLDARAMLVVRWNLFNGGIDKARIWEAKARALEAAEVSASTRRIIERETRVSWNALMSARARVPQYQSQLDYARQTRSTYSAQFDGGQRRLLDLLNIQAEVFLAESSLRTEELVRAYNVYRILAAAGRLVSSLGLELPTEAVTPHAPTVVDGWRDGVQNWR